MTCSRLQFQDIGKSFPGVRALDGVSFGARAGSIHALLGENGAGKSTLLKILSGAHRADSGAIVIDGRPRTFRSTAEAIRSGVAVIYQELHLVPELSVEENILLGHLPSRCGWIRAGRIRRDAARILDRLGEPIDPAAKVRSLPIGQRQMVEIAKALSHDAGVWAFDEPTSSLSAAESQRLFRILRDLRARGGVVLYVSHRMDEIFAVCDAATVLRDGRHVRTFDRLAEATRDDLVRAMVGRPLQDAYRYAPRALGATALDVDGVLGPGLAEPARFAVAQGEIAGFFGLVGSGRTELMKLLYGAVRPTAGAIRIQGRVARIRSPREALGQGLFYCPEDRKREGLVPLRSVQENLNLGCRRRLARLGFAIDEAAERERATRVAGRLGVRMAGLAQPVRHLSGGNQQKVLLGRWWDQAANVLLLDEPTRGIDVGAKEEIYALVHDAARRGVAVVVVSSELPEVLGLCDRVLVMRQGRIVADLPRGRATEEEVLQWALPAAGSTGPAA